MSGQALNLNDLAKQLRMMRTLSSASGGLGGLLNLMPGMGGLAGKLEGKIDAKMLTQQLAILSSMTPAERANPIILNGRRRLRIAKGSGTDVAQINKLIKMHEQMTLMAKMFRSGNLGALLGKK
jgi:signal recognition particle subunit SRP54